MIVINVIDTILGIGLRTVLLIASVYALFTVPAALADIAESLSVIVQHIIASSNKEDA